MKDQAEEPLLLDVSHDEHQELCELSSGEQNPCSKEVLCTLMKKKNASFIERTERRSSRAQEDDDANSEPFIYPTGPWISPYRVLQ